MRIAGVILIKVISYFFQFVLSGSDTLGRKDQTDPPLCSRRVHPMSRERSGAPSARVPERGWGARTLHGVGVGACGEGEGGWRLAT